MFANADETEMAVTDEFASWQQQWRQVFRRYFCRAVFSAFHGIGSNAPQPQDLLLNCLLLPQHPSVCVEEQVLKSPCCQICN
jgi:hypothetical protein